MGSSARGGCGNRRWLQAAFFAAFLAMFLTGCADRYFRDAGEPGRQAPRYGLADLPVNEYWTGIAFNGRKIGFSHFVITPLPGEADRFEIRSEAVLHLRFYTMDKKVTLRSYDLVDGGLRLRDFVYEYDMDGNRLMLTGAFENEVLKVVRLSRGTNSEEEIAVDGDLYPASSLCLYPLVKGLKVGNRYEYRIYDGETQSVETVHQEVQAYQRSDLFAGEAYRVQTRCHGQEVLTWLDEQGIPVLEKALGGVLVSSLESEGEARKYLLESALNRDDGLLKFSLIRIDPPLSNARSSTYSEMYLDGVPEDIVIPSDGRQECDRQECRVLCRIRAEMPRGLSAPPSADREEYLAPSPTVPITAEIRTLAGRITRGAPTEIEQVRLIISWMHDNISREPVDAFTALDVLSRRKAECQGHALLYAAFARSVGIPTRVANGIVYADDFQGFLYHSWNESLVQGRWIAVDPVLSQVPADATHVKFLEGEALSSLVPLVSMVGRIGIEIIEVR
jgi:hypothetical protein